ncbi:histone chaperone domain CHZ-domain-containing protein [Apiospora aurea]|uniref:Histone chaperone domain CHZ-domain-containing protein n=1 Tax=Apiospora aurea TaxID=335848 RepID=A0ABR1Q6X8_9PEZI
MSSSNGATVPEQTNQAAQQQVEKGKGKAANAEEPVDQSMDEDSDDDEEAGDDAAEEDDDNMDEIDLNNIVEGGRRTRGKVIDWAKAAENVPTNEEDEDDDDDFEGEGEKEDDKMDED